MQKFIILIMRRLEDKQIHQKGRQDASAWASEMKEDTLWLEWATSNNFKIMNTQFQKKAGGDRHGEALMDTLE